jgi:N utilization substance protein B
MSRRQAREVALQALFQLDFNGPDLEEQRGAYETLAIDAALGEVEGEPVTKKDRRYIESVVLGTRQNLEQIDEMIGRHAKGWKVSRMAAVDRNLARLAVYEMCLADEKLAPGIVINEAVELDKNYDEPDTVAFVNGVLGGFMRGEFPQEEA